HVFERIGETEALGNFGKCAVPLIHKKEIGTALIPCKNIHTGRNQRQRDERTAARDQIDAGASRDILDEALLIQLIEAHGAAIVGDKKSVIARPITVDTGDRPPCRHIGRDLIFLKVEEVDPACTTVQEEAVAKTLGTVECIRVQNIDFFPTVAVDVGSSHTNGLTVGVCQLFIGSINERPAVPLQNPIGEAETCDENLK